MNILFSRGKQGSHVQNILLFYIVFVKMSVDNIVFLKIHNYYTTENFEKLASKFDTFLSHSLIIIMLAIDVIHIRHEDINTHFCPYRNYFPVLKWSISVYIIFLRHFTNIILFSVNLDHTKIIWHSESTIWLSIDDITLLLFTETVPNITVNDIQFAQWFTSCSHFWCSYYITLLLYYYYTTDIS